MSSGYSSGYIRLLPQCLVFPVVEQIIFFFKIQSYVKSVLFVTSIYKFVSLVQMLKRALGETGDESKPAEEDKHSHHSDSVMECRRAPRPIGTSCTFLSTFSSFHVSSSFHEPYFPRRRDVMLLPYTDKPGVDRPPRTRSLSPSPPPVRPSSQSMLEGAPIPDTRQHTAQRRHDKLRPFQDQRRKSQVRQRLDIAYSFVNCWSLNSIFCPGLGF